MTKIDSGSVWIWALQNHTNTILLFHRMSQQQGRKHDKLHNETTHNKQRAWTELIDLI